MVRDVWVIVAICAFVFVASLVGVVRLANLRSQSVADTGAKIVGVAGLLLLALLALTFGGGTVLMMTIEF